MVNLYDFIHVKLISARVESDGITLVCADRIDTYYPTVPPNVFMHSPLGYPRFSDQIKKSYILLFGPKIGVPFVIQRKLMVRV